MKPSYTDFDLLKCIASTENQKQSPKTNPNSWYNKFVFDNKDVYSSMLNKKDKINQVWNHLIPN